MSESLHDIDKFFHDNIEEHSEYPPKKVWDKIEAGLDKDTAVTYKKKYQIVKRAAIILLILFLGVLLYELVGRHASNEGLAGINKKNQQQGSTPTRKNDSVSSFVKKDNNVNQTQDQQNNLSANEKKNLQDNQLPLVSPNNQKRAIENNPGNNEQRKDKKIIPGKEDYVDVKQPTIKKDAQRNAEFEIITATKNNNKKEDDNNADSKVAINTTINDQAGNAEPVKRSFPLLTSGDSWKKDIANVWSSSLTIPESGSPSILDKLFYPKVKKSANPLFRNYGFSLSAYFSPNATWNSIHDDKPYRISSSGGGGSVDHDEIKRSERNSFAYSAGIKLGYGVSKKITIQSGINFTKSSTTVRPKDIYAEQDNNGNVRYRFDCSSGYTYISPHSGTTPSPGDTIALTTNHSTLSYLGLPLAIEYRISFGKFGISASAGGQLNMLLDGETTAVLGRGTSKETATSSKTQGLRSSYISAITSITGEWQMNNKLSLTLAPSGQFGLSSINNGASVKTRPNYLGLAAGLKLKL